MLCANALSEAVISVVTISQALNPAQPGPLALKPSRPGLKCGQAGKMWKAGEGNPRVFIVRWSKATGVSYYVITSACIVALIRHRAIQLGLPRWMKCKNRFQIVALSKINAVPSLWLTARLANDLSGTWEQNRGLGVVIGRWRYTLACTQPLPI